MSIPIKIKAEIISNNFCRGEPPRIQIYMFYSLTVNVNSIGSTVNHIYVAIL